VPADPGAESVEGRDRGSVAHSISSSRGAWHPASLFILVSGIRDTPRRGQHGVLWPDSGPPGTEIAPVGKDAVGRAEDLDDGDAITVQLIVAVPDRRPGTPTGLPD
jgi:hypothetical protein